MTRKRVFKISFTNQGKVYEIYARKVQQGEMYGFVEIEDIVFGERSSLLVDPGEEQLKLEFSGVRRTHIPFHSVIRIDEVEKEGTGKILQIANQANGATAVANPLPIPDQGPKK